MRLVPLYMELLVSRDGTQTLMHMIEDTLNYFQIFLVDHLDQRIVLAEEVKTDISIAWCWSHYSDIDTSIFRIIVAKLDIIARFYQNLLTALHSRMTVSNR